MFCFIVILLFKNSSLYFKQHRFVSIDWDIIIISIKLIKDARFKIQQLYK